MPEGMGPQAAAVVRSGGRVGFTSLDYFCTVMPLPGETHVLVHYTFIKALFI